VVIIWDIIKLMNTKFAVIYSKSTGRIRWEFCPDDDSQLNDIRLLDGEDVLILKNSDRTILPDLQDKINKKTGKVPQDDRYAVVDSLNNVVSVIIADPLCGDSVPSCQLIAHPTASPGWKLKNNVLEAPIEIVGEII
jgi:hypothetical protein